MGVGSVIMEIDFFIYSLPRGGTIHLIRKGVDESERSLQLRRYLFELYIIWIVYKCSCLIHLWVATALVHDVVLLVSLFA